MTGPAVALVGGGPGDPGLLTLRAEALLGTARTVVTDAGVAELARTFAGRAEVVVVPDAGRATTALLAAVSLAAAPVVRLYRGDPWLHPAYGPERAALERAGIAVEAVAGVAVEVAVPALAGIAVHVRQLAVACTLGPFEALPPATDAARTLVATGNDPAVAVRAVAAGWDPRLPAALVPLADPASAQRGTLARVADSAEKAADPLLLVVGAVCGTTADGGPPPAGGEGDAVGGVSGSSPTGGTEARAQVT